MLSVSLTPKVSLFQGHLLVSHFYSNTLMLYTGPTDQGGGGESLGPLLRGKVLRGPVGMVVGPDEFL